VWCGDPVLKIKNNELKTWGDSHIKKKKQGRLSYALGVKKVGLVPLRVFSLKRFTAGAFAVPF